MLTRKRPPIITLLTDFGTQDSFVAEMKGVILSQVPHVQLIDITHEIPAFDIEKAAHILNQACWAFPEGTIHLAVVDPGVGSERKPIILQVQGHYFVGPDNGLFSLIAQRDKRIYIYEIIKINKKVSLTFHGRDIFAPVAAELARGHFLKRLGRPINSIVRLADISAKQLRGNKWEGKIASIDRFGNMATNIPGQILKKFKKPCMIVGKKKITSFPKTFCYGKPNQPGVIVNSEGYLEIMIPKKSAQKQLELKKGQKVVLAEAN